jgi:hypothetical protein
LYVCLFSSHAIYKLNANPPFSLITKSVNPTPLPKHSKP